MTNAELKEILLERFLRYVRVETTSDPASASCPSTPGQIEFAQQLLVEMERIGLVQCRLDENGYLYGTLPTNETPTAIPVIGFLAHIDTSPAVSGANVEPRVHRNYSGGTIAIDAGEDIILSPAECPALSNHVGHDIVTAGGGTLLGADNKAGIAIILSFIQFLLDDPETRHGTVQVAFTPDEEIGRGMDNFDVARFAATYAYTVDGDLLGSMEDECFNADAVEIEIHGRSIHPGSARNLMANAARITAEIAASWPETMLPETTTGRQGFVMFTDMTANVEYARVSGIVRHHDMDAFAALKDRLAAIVDEIAGKHPNATIDMQFDEQYRNMKTVIDAHPSVVEKLRLAYADEGVTANIKAIRGGTDGSRLSFMGVPTPNIFTGGMNFHGRDEWISADSMVKAVKVLRSLARRWTEA